MAADTALTRESLLGWGPPLLGSKPPFPLPPAHYPPPPDHSALSSKPLPGAPTTFLLEDGVPGPHDSPPLLPPLHGGRWTTRGPPFLAQGHPLVSPPSQLGVIPTSTSTSPQNSPGKADTQEMHVEETDALDTSGQPGAYGQGREVPPHPL